MGEPLTLRLSDAAELDLAEIWSYAASEGSEDFATSLIRTLVARFDEVRCFPRAGAPRFHLAPELRVVFEGKFALYYVPRVDEIVIVRVLHGARDISAIAVAGGLLP